MNGPQLQALRQQRQLTQSQLADFLGDTSPATVSKWEAGKHAIPQWVEDKMLATTGLSLPLEMLQKLMAYASAQNLDFGDILRAAVTDYLRKQSAVENLRPAAAQLPYIIEIPPEPKVAELPPGSD